MKRLAVFYAMCALAAATPWLRDRAEPTTVHEFPGWPMQFEGAALRAVPLEERERRFTEGFPGKIAKFQAGDRQLVLRWVERPTRQLHPAADCYRGSGYQTEPAPMRTGPDGRRWSCFAAHHDDDSVQVCEQLRDNAGNWWPDVSAWYWAALVGQSEGPWWAVTMIEPAGEVQ